MLQKEMMLVPAVTSLTVNGFYILVKILCQFCPLSSASNHCIQLKHVTFILHLALYNFALKSAFCWQNLVIWTHLSKRSDTDTVDIPDLDATISWCRDYQRTIVSLTYQQTVDHIAVGMPGCDQSWRNKNKGGFSFKCKHAANIN